MSKHTDEIKCDLIRMEYEGFCDGDYPLGEIYAETFDVPEEDMPHHEHYLQDMAAFCLFESWFCRSAQMYLDKCEERDR